MKLCHKMKVYKRGNGEDNVFWPEIRLSGQWVRENGFDIGSKITVTILDFGKILIEKIDDKKED